MLVNLSEYIDIDIYIVGLALKDLGWKQDDTGYFSTKIERYPDLFIKEVLTEKVDAKKNVIVADGNLSTSNNVSIFGSETKDKKRELMMHLGLYLSAHILYYTEYKHYQSVIWVQCNFCAENINVIEVMMKYIKEETIPTLPWKPFYDEDAWNKNFKQPTKNMFGWWESAFYLNPDYPKGYWDNHTI